MTEYCCVNFSAFESCSLYSFPLHTKSFALTHGVFILGRILLVTFCFQQTPSLFGRRRNVFFWYRLLKTAGFVGLQNLLSPKLEGFADIARNLILPLKFMVWFDFVLISLAFSAAVFFGVGNFSCQVYRFQNSESLPKTEGYQKIRP